MKTVLAGLQNSIQSSYSNNGKTTTFGRAFQKMINSQNVIGPQLTQWLDLLQTYALYPLDAYYNPNTGHLFVLSSPTLIFTATNIWVQLFNFSSATSWVPSYVGRVNLNFGNSAASTPAIKGFEVYESGGNITPVVTIAGSVAVLGGKYIANNLTTASFTVGGSTAFPASGSNQAGYMYFLQDPAALGVGHVATTAWGSALPQFSSSSGVKTKAWQANGTFALPQMYSWDLSVTPTVAGQVTNGVSAQTTVITGSTPNAYFSMAANNGYSPTIGEQVVLMAGTGSVPTAFTAWVANTLQTTSNVYFMRDLQQLWTFTFSGLTTAISAGATYTNGGFTFTCVSTALLGATSALFSVTGSGISTPSGNLVLASGIGQSPITILTATAGNFIFNLSVTSGAAATVPTSTTSLFTMMRAFGICSSNFSLKTGVLTAITGGALVTNTMNYCKPISSPANTTLQGADCIAFQSTTSLYIFKISDLTSLTTTWPSLIPAGILNTGTGLDVTAITTTQGAYSGEGNTGELDNFILVTNTSTFIAKQFKAAGSPLTAVFGGTTNNYYAGQNPVTIQSGLTAVTQIHTMGGWLFIAGTTTGQAGLVIMDMGSDANFGLSGVVSPVLNIPSGTVYKYISALEQLFNYTDSMNFWVRSASTRTDTSFDSVTLPVGSPSSAGATSNGWASLQTALDNSSVAVGPYFQIFITFDILTLLVNTPAQIYDVVSAILPPAEQSDYWAMDNDNTTQGLGSPSYVSWRQQTAYPSNPTNLVAQVYDTGGNLIFSSNLTSLTNWSYSTNDGVSWTSVSSVGSIPFGVDLRLRILVNPTPVVTVAQPSLRES